VPYFNRGNKKKEEQDMQKRTMGLTAVVLALSLCFSGCGLFLDTAMDSAADEMGRSVGEQIAADMTGPMYRAYAWALMAAYFWAGGYWLAWHPYQPGEWTKWKHEAEEAQAEEGAPNQPLYVEKAFLKRNDDGSEWWRIKAFQDNPDETVIFEALFSADRTQVVRLLGKMGANPIQEITFEEGENSFPAPVMFEDGYINKHSVGTVELATGSVSWSANHVQFKAHDASGQADFFFSDKVPGGLVKYQFANNQGDKYTILLDGHGSGATSELGAY
jgi:hypothetical protein